MPPLGMSSKGRGGLELDEEEVRDGLSEMSPPWIMKPGMRRWKGVLLYAPLAQRAMKFCVVVSWVHWGIWSERRWGGREVCTSAVLGTASQKSSTLRSPWVVWSWSRVGG